MQQQRLDQLSEDCNMLYARSELFISCPTAANVAVPRTCRLYNIHTRCKYSVRSSRDEHPTVLPQVPLLKR